MSESLSSRNCIKCGDAIPAERLEVLENTKLCVKCSQVKKPKGITIWDEGTPILEIVDEETAETVKRLERLDGRQNRLK